MTLYPASLRDNSTAENQKLKIIKFKDPQVKDYVKDPADYKHKMQKGDNVDIAKINSGLRYGSYILDHSNQNEIMRNKEPVVKNVENKPTLNVPATKAKREQVKEDIKDSFNYCHNTYKGEKTDYSLNYLLPNESAYRVRRFEVYHQKKDGSAIAKDLTSVYKDTF